MSGHTKGPWRVERHRSGSGVARKIYPANRMYRIAEMAGDPRTADENEANANLIAAAPTLLEALEGLVAAVNDEADGEHGIGGVLAIKAAQAMAAINAATGGQQ